MKIVLMMTGKTRTSWLNEGIEVYMKRLRHYVPVEMMVLPDVKTTKGMTEEKQKELEGEVMLQRFGGGDHVILLDERGEELTSRQLATRLDRLMATQQHNIFMVIGGPYGFSQAVYDRADRKLSFSRMTFSHEMIRLLLVEQVYRAMTILKGEPYHHD